MLQTIFPLNALCVMRMKNMTGTSAKEFMEMNLVLMIKIEKK